MSGHKLKIVLTMRNDNCGARNSQQKTRNSRGKQIFSKQRTKQFRRNEWSEAGVQAPAKTPPIYGARMQRLDLKIIHAKF
jgi:hypothetical protein